MKHIVKNLVAILVATSALSVHAMNTNSSNKTFGKPYFQGRSQGENLARRLVGDAFELYECDTECLNGVVALIAQWGQTFDRNDLGNYFSLRNPSRQDATTMSFRGSLVQDATPANTDIRAENFLLASNFDGLVTLKPQKRDFVADINFRLNLNEWLCGLYFEIDVPINWTSWSMNLTDTTPVARGTDISIDSSDPTLISPFTSPSQVHSIIDAWKGLTNGTANFTGTPEVGDPITVPITIEKMNFARIDGKQSKAGVADLNFILGYNVICNECYHFSANIRATAPTGTRPQGEFLFEPVVGNGRHTTLGVGLNGHAILWDSGCDQSFSIWFDSAVYHLFGAQQKRTFDLKGNGIGSRYLLYKKFTKNESNQNVFTDTFVPGPKVHTVDSKVKINVGGEAIVLFDYQHCGLTIDVGYGVWGRSKENISITGTILPDTFGLLGGTPINPSDVSPDARNRTNSMVRINGENASVIGDVNAEGEPVQLFTTVTNLDVQGAQAPSALSHKVFTHLGYTWDCCDYAPFFGVGGEVEFSGKENRAFDQWAVWAKIGFAYS